MKIVNLVLAIAIFGFAMMGLFDFYLFDGDLQRFLLSMMMGAFFVLHSRELEKTRTRSVLTCLGYFVLATGMLRFFRFMV